MQETNLGETDKIIALVKAANKKIRLSSLLKEIGYNIVNNGRNWSENIVCPFPSHKRGTERTGSFAYNYVTDSFFCLGCGKSGRSVEFLAELNGLSRTAVANDIILGTYKKQEVELEEYSEDISPLLFELSSKMQKLYQKYKNDKKKLQSFDKIMLFFDKYITDRAPTQKVSSEEIRQIIDKIFKDLIVGEEF